MKITQKRWSTLGLGVALVSGVVSACDPKEVATETTSTPIQVTDLNNGGEGEGGIDIASASTDPIIYHSALAITEAHIIAARDAYKLGKSGAAAEMFAHPVSEVLADMADVFVARGVENFDDLLIDASTSVLNNDEITVINAKAEAIIIELSKAADKSPNDGSTKLKIAIGVIADQTERAADMYLIAQQTGEYGPYLDGYGFFKAGEKVYNSIAKELKTSNPALQQVCEQVLNLLEKAYPSAISPDDLNANPSELVAASSKILLAQ